MEGRAGTRGKLNPARQIHPYNQSALGKKEENLRLSQARAMVVRQYLAKKFKVDDARIRTMGVGDDQQTAGAGSVTISIYSGSREDRLAVAKNR